MAVPSPDEDPEKWYAALLRLAFGAMELASHGGMLALILLVTKGIEVLLKRLWGTDRLLLGWVPESRVFEAADLALLVIFLTIGIWVILRAYYRGRGGK